MNNTNFQNLLNYLNVKGFTTPIDGSTLNNVFGGKTTSQHLGVHRRLKNLNRTIANEHKKYINKMRVSTYIAKKQAKTRAKKQANTRMAGYNNGPLVPHK